MFVDKASAFMWEMQTGAPRPVSNAAKVAWNSRPPVIIVEDELTGNKSQGPSGWCKAVDGNGEPCLQVPGSPLCLKQNFTESGGVYIWDLYFHLPADADFRSIRVDLLFPLPLQGRSPDGRYEWMCWAPASALPAPLSRIGRQTFSYDHIQDHISIPMITLYEPGHDTGITYYKPFEVKAPAMDYRITNIRDFNIENQNGLEVETRHLAVYPGKYAHVSIGMFIHEGDWRPALGRMLGLYPDYFKVHTNNPASIDGPMVCGVFDARSPLTQPVVDKLKALDFTWEEVHAYFPCYGCYQPDEEEWWSVLKMEIPEGAVKVSRKTIHEHIRLLKKNGVKAYIYWQPGECFEPFAREKFKDCMVVDKDGSSINGWMNCVFMNYDTGTRWGRYILDQAFRLVDEYPEADGLFLDNLVYRFCDFSRQDGLTALQNRPCSKLTFAYDDILAKLTDEMHSRGKGIMCNGALNIELARFVDSIMGETDPSLLGYLQYLSINKPLVLLDYDISESAMWPCLLAGAFPALNMPKGTGDGHSFKEKEEIFRIYLPLLQPLKGRRWVLSAHPLVLPKQVKGNIFSLADGSYAVTMLPVSGSVRSPEGLKDFDIVLNLDKDICKSLKHAVSLRADDCSTNYLPVTLQDDGLHVRVDWHRTAATVVVSAEKIDTGEWTRFWSGN